MVFPEAQLSAIAGSLTELTDRVTALADAARDARDDDIATELYEIERMLRAANRRLERLLG